MSRVTRNTSRMRAVGPASFSLPPRPEQRGVGVHQLAEAGAVDVLERGEIQHHLALSLGHRGLDA
jgi:hypothetical protein